MGCKINKNTYERKKSCDIFCELRNTGTSQNMQIDDNITALNWLSFLVFVLLDSLFFNLELAKANWHL